MCASYSKLSVYLVAESYKNYFVKATLRSCSRRFMRLIYFLNYIVEGLYLNYKTFMPIIEIFFDMIHSNYNITTASMSHLNVVESV